MFEKVVQFAKNHPNPEGTTFSYGTAGFRTKGEILDGVVFRMGCLAALRSKSKQGKAIGVMVTASHNPEEDNGLKLVDPDGEMLAANWEKYATELANSKIDELAMNLEKIIKSENIDFGIEGKVIVGRDTRPTSSPLISSVKDGISSLDSKIVDLGEVTTPQLHFSVRMVNRGLPGDEESYFKTFSEAYRKAIIGASSKYEKLYIDGSNGIGAPKAQILAKHLEGVHEFEIRNVSGKLNYQVGADFVKTSQKIPNGVDGVNDRNKKFASIDGDADRVIYYYLDNDGKFHMLDGDKIATLAAMYIREEINKLGGKVNLSMGVVQTAYANGASSIYLHDTMKIELACVPTGVKHLHHKAADFDIGVYFEANGHGTVLFNEEAIHRLENLKKSWEKDGNISNSEKEALDRLLNLPNLINQAIGDALSDILLVETVLRQKGWTLKEWDALYTDLPNRLKAQKVKDRNKFKTTDAERKLTEPVGMQEKLDQLVSKYPHGRSFVRPSGTEDVVRIYAEAETQEDADKLSKEVSELVEAFS